MAIIRYLPKRRLNIRVPTSSGSVTNDELRKVTDDIMRYLNKPPDDFGNVLTDRPDVGEYPGDTFFVISTMDLYLWTGTQWILGNIPYTVYNAKGDLLVGTGADTASILTVGANLTMPVADSTQTTGIAWITPATIRTNLALVPGTNLPIYTKSNTTPVGTGANGDEHWNTTALRNYHSNGATWQITGGSLPRASATKISVQSVPHATGTIVTYPDTEDYDTDTIHSTAVNTGRMTIPAGMGGMWTFSYSIYIPASIAGRGSAWLQKNGGSNRWAWQGYTIIGPTDDQLVSGAADILVAAGDYIEVIFFHFNAGSVARNIGIVSFNNFFTASYRNPT